MVDTPQEGGIAETAEAAPTIGIVMLTHNRVHLLRQCVENVVGRVSAFTTEVVIWDNASSDGTSEYLRDLRDPRIRVVCHDQNIGLNGYAEAAALTTTSHIIDLDDDMVGAPIGWDKTLLDAYRRIPNMGFLASDLEEDEHDFVSLLRYRDRPHLYTEFELNGVRLLHGPVGGFCAMTHRELYDRAGGFPRHSEPFFQEDAEYIEAIEKLGFRAATLADLKLHHTGGRYYAGNLPKVKSEYWRTYWTTVRRRNAIKRVLMRLPLVPALNRRWELFGPPQWEPPRYEGSDTTPPSP